ncbi:hypothetical protein [Flagellimonas lutaonensis]|uniref:Putative hydrolase n=1 Tax=Flagellimonas lutaonensis TaxID=516051 RepID=A0A0D5YWD2_9FLAO|nr:hypothetical protein [Allomuricauda lutaonensis]AKA36231.1 Putative hydrolase [Allomuricauda lutaonensis]
MKSKIYLYLFLFTALICLYLLVSGNKMQNQLGERNVKLEEKVEQLEDSLQKMQMRLMDMQYFALENNDDALAYYDHLNLENPTRYIEDKLLETNERKGNNPLVPYEGMEGDFKINKIKVLNHRWIVADFSDGKYWGDLIIRYELKDDLGVDFELVDHLLYTRSQ